MIPLFEKTLRAVARFRKKASARFQKHKQREMEAERLDRLRNPGNYQGR
jgi:hypothetical protein